MEPQEAFEAAFEECLNQWVAPLEECTATCQEILDEVWDGYPDYPGLPGPVSRACTAGDDRCPDLLAECEAALPY